MLISNLSRRGEPDINASKKATQDYIVQANHSR